MSILEKEEKLCARFAGCQGGEEIYRKIIELGKKLEPYPAEFLREEYLVEGCQSRMHLYAEEREGRLYFRAASDALISAGLAALLIEVYDGESPEKILGASATFLERMHLPQSLTPGRANGLASLYLRIKKIALSARLNGLESVSGSRRSSSE
jgi:sulfur transfer protein SufE